MKLWLVCVPHVTEWGTQLRITSNTDEMDIYTPHWDDDDIPSVTLVANEPLERLLLKPSISLRQLPHMYSSAENAAADAPVPPQSLQESLLLLLPLQPFTVMILSKFLRRTFPTRSSTPLIKSLYDDSCTGALNSSYYRINE
jgi:hypothetical protein